MREILICIIALSVFLGNTAVYAQPQGRPSPTLKDAVAMARDGRCDEAIELIKKIISQNPPQENKEAYLSMGVVYFKCKKYDNALNAFESAAGIMKESPMAYYFIGMIYEKKAVGETERDAARLMKQKALDAWQLYLTYSGKTEMKSLGSHRNACVTVENGVATAKKHVKLLTEDLSND